MCKYCDEPEADGDYHPCCEGGTCEALFGDKEYSNCVHCGAEMFQENETWYHHSQKEYPIEKRYLEHTQQYEKANH